MYYLSISNNRLSKDLSPVHLIWDLESFQIKWTGLTVKRVEKTIAVIFTQINISGQISRIKQILCAPIKIVTIQVSELTEFNLKFIFFAAHKFNKPK